MVSRYPRMFSEWKWTRKRCVSILCINNNLCTYGKSEKEHNSNLFNLMQVASNNSHIFKCNKSQIKCPKITLYGTIFTKESMKPQKFLLSDVQQVKSLLGMINFMQPCIPHLSYHKAPLRELLNKTKSSTGMTTETLNSRS